MMLARSFAIIVAMKRCGRCRELKSVDCFGFRKKDLAIRHSVCKSCQATYRTAYVERHGKDALHARIYAHTVRYRRRNRAFVHRHLQEHPCVDCGLADVLVLEFDHVTGTKEGTIAVMVREGVSLKRLRAEIAKCVVRCANCHRRRTALTLWGRSL